MTTLRDDGYLETDDPVVAACFIDHVVEAEQACDMSDRPGHWLNNDPDDEWVEENFKGKLGSVFNVGAWLYEELGDDEGTPVDFPIRIPAATVGALIDDIRVSMVLQATVDQGATAIISWLHTHTEVTDV